MHARMLRGVIERTHLLECGLELSELHDGTETSTSHFELTLYLHAIKSTSPVTRKMSDVS